MPKGHIGNFDIAVTGQVGTPPPPHTHFLLQQLTKTPHVAVGVLGAVFMGRRVWDHMPLPCGEGVGVCTSVCVGGGVLGPECLLWVREGRGDRGRIKQSFPRWYGLCCPMLLHIGPSPIYLCLDSLHCAPTSAHGPDGCCSVAPASSGSS